MTKKPPERTPAQVAADKAQAEVHESIAQGKNFLLEAGAGAGKTYSLIEALKHLIEKRGKELVKNRQQVACITYTNVASEEIQSRTDRHPAVLSSTIHSFCWSLIKDHQPFLRAKIPSLPKFGEKLAEVGGTVGNRIVEYDLGHRTVSDTHVSLWHNDVIALTVALMEEPKFRSLLAARYPVLFVDEYQDTNKDFAEALKKHFLGKGEGPRIGFFGDHWQKIYSDVCGKIEHPSLIVIKKGSNFRSAKVIVDVLNRMRPELPQAVSDPALAGSARVFHTNDWKGARRTDGQWKGDLPADVAHKYLEGLMTILQAEGWNFEGDVTKILMLTNNLLAKEQGYSSFSEIFDYPDSFLKKEDPHIAFLADTVEPVSLTFQNKRYGEMFTALDARTPKVLKHGDKEAWAKDLDTLIKLRENDKIDAVLQHVRRTQRPRLPEPLEQSEAEFEAYLKNPPAEPNEKMELRRKLGAVTYTELIALDNFIDDKTPFSTKHGVKGAEFENVLVVVGRGWNLYDFNQMLGWIGTGVPNGKESTFERNRNLFYVSCSRPKVRLAVLFTQQLSDAALETLRKLFGDAAVGELMLRA